jgi:hypothetical protein
VIYERADHVAALRACEQAQACQGDIRQSIRSCEADAFRRLEPSAADHEYCAHFVERAAKCGDSRWDEAHCLNGTKAYTDVILGQLSDCLDRPCRNFGRCLVAVVGEDEGYDDPDRVLQRINTPVPDAGSPSVAIAGSVAAEPSAPVAGAKVCLVDLKGPCVVTASSGAFALPVPAHAEVAISVAASGFAQSLVGFATRGTSIRATIVLHPEAMARARYASLGAPYPSDTHGFLFVTAAPPAGSPSGLEGLTVDVTPRPGHGPLYFSPTSEVDPQRTATSTWSSAAFAEVQPGEVNVTFGPPSVTCVPSFGGWPSTLPNTIRAPIAPGFESRVVVQCHK